jgi:hypothetical protein
VTAFNDNLAFIHIPKTAGHACRAYFHEHLTDTHELREFHPDDGFFGHVALRDLEQYSGRAPSSFERIFAVIRDPYEQQLSQWLFWKDEYARGFRHKAREHAAMHPDLSFWLLDPESDYHVWDKRPVMIDGNVIERTVAEDVVPPESGYSMFGGFYRYWLGDETGEIPDNVEVVRFEHLSEEFPMALKPWAGVVRPMEKKNEGPAHRPDPVPYYSELAIELVERKFAHAFDQEWYERWER